MNNKLYQINFTIGNCSVSIVICIILPPVPDANNVYYGWAANCGGTVFQGGGSFRTVNYEVPGEINSESLDSNFENNESEGWMSENNDGFWDQLNVFLANVNIEEGDNYDGPLPPAYPEV